MATKLFSQVKSAVLADLKDKNLRCEDIEGLIFDFLSEVIVHSQGNTAEEWDALELHDKQQAEND
jgi:hypothetical protein